MGRNTRKSNEFFDVGIVSVFIAKSKIRFYWLLKAERILVAEIRISVSYKLFMARSLSGWKRKLMPLGLSASGTTTLKRSTSTKCANPQKFGPL